MTRARSIAVACTAAVLLSSALVQAQPVQRDEVGERYLAQLAQTAAKQVMGWKAVKASPTVSLTPGISAYPTNNRVRRVTVQNLGPKARGETFDRLVVTIDSQSRDLAKKPLELRREGPRSGYRRILKIDRYGGFDYRGTNAFSKLVQSSPRNPGFIGYRGAATRAR